MIFHLAEVHDISFWLLSCFIQPVFMMFLAVGFHDVLLKSAFMIFHSDGFHISFRTLSWCFMMVHSAGFYDVSGSLHDVSFRCLSCFIQAAFMLFYSAFFHVTFIMFLSFSQLSWCFKEGVSRCFIQVALIMFHSATAFMMFPSGGFPDVSFM